MTETQISLILKEMYNNAPDKYQSAMIHIFAIHYADVITKNKFSKKVILNIAGMSDNYATELSKGIKISEFVNVSEEMIQTIKNIEASIL